jgi:PAS domain S-box-containing protein
MRLLDALSRLLVKVRERARTGKPAAAPAFLRIYRGVLAGGVLLALVSVGLAVRRQHDAALEEWRARLAIIADGEEQYVREWLQERRADGEILASRPSVAGTLVSALPARGRAERAAAAGRLFDGANRLYRYSAVYAIDPQGTVRASSAGAPALPAGLVGMAKGISGWRLEVLPESAWQSLNARLALLHPVEQNGRRLGALLVLTQAKELYSLPALGFSGMRTGESLLARPDAGRVVFFSPPRRAINRRPLPGPLAVRTVLEQRSFSGEHLDYSRRRVMLNTRYIPEIGWGLIVKIDRDEVLEHFTALAVLEIAGSVAILAALVAAAWALWRHQQSQRLRLEVARRKQAEEALRESEDRLKLSLSATRMGVWDLDLISGRAWRSIEHDQIFGYESLQPEWGREIFLGHVLPEDREFVEGRFEQAYRDGRLRFECRIRHAGQEIRWIAVEGKTFYDGHGKPVRMMGVVADITERKEGEEALRRSEAELQEAHRVARLGRWSVDAATGLVTWSEELYRMLGFDPAAPPPPYAEHCRLFTPESWARLSAALPKTIETGIPYELELEMVRPDGSRGWMMARGEAVRNGATITGLRGVALDVTERKRAADELRRLNAELEQRVRERTAQLRESEERLTLALRASQEGVWDWDLETNAVWFSPRWKEMLGYAESEIEPHFSAWERLLHPDDKARVREDLEAALRGVRDYETEFRLRHKHGRYVDILARGFALRREAGGPVVRMVGTHFDLTERKRAEAALRESEARLRLALHFARMAAWDWYVPTGDLIWNDEHYRMMGYQPGEVKPSYQSWIDRVHPEDRAATEGTLRRAMDEGADYIAEFRTLWPDGTVHWIEARGAFERDAAGKPVRSYGVMLDTTERKRAEAALRESQERLSLVLEAARLGTWDRDLVSEALVWSPRCLAIFGLPPDTRMTLERFLEALHPDDRERVARAGRETVEEHKDYDVEMRTVWPDGTLHWVASRGRAYYDSSGRPVRISGASLDITARKQAEEALRESEERFRVLANTIPELVWTCTPDGRCDYLNERWVEYTGIPMADQLGDAWLERVHPDDRQPTMAAWRRSVESGAPYEVVFRIRRKDGAYRWFQTRGTALRDPGGRILKWFGTNTDIEELRRSEEALREKTAQLEAANRELEAFSYSVSHDLRAPLRQIGGFSRILQEEFAAALEPDALHYLFRIEQGTSRMGQLIDDLLGLSRISRRAMTLQVTGLNSVVEEAVAGLAPECERRAVEWKIGALPFVECDPSLMKVVFQNLLSNALKFTRPRDPAVIEVGRTEREGQTVIFVRDNGVGFSMKYADKLFGVFQRLHRAEDFEGTGVGLVTVQRIIQRHGGRIWAEAELDQGATFYFTLGGPLDQRETQEIGQEAL